LDLIEFLLKLSDLDNFGFPICIEDGKSVGIVDDVENIGFDILFDDVNFFGFISEFGSSEQFFKSSNVFFDSMVGLGEVFDFFSCSGLEMRVVELSIHLGLGFRTGNPRVWRL
jgi:hypothetical protein